MSRLRALALYKDLLRLAKDYPDPHYNYHARIRRLFENNRHLTREDDIQNALNLGDYIRKETLALYSLKKYRHLKRMYPSSPY
ncbi:hypothetical protein JOM56_001385 [Amanita muscaria]